MLRFRSPEASEGPSGVGHDLAVIPPEPPPVPVITSYSIHYTKLYEVKRGNGGQDGVVYDAFLENDVCDFFLQAIGHRRRFRGDHGEIVAYPTRAFRRLRGAESEHP